MHRILLKRVMEEILKLNTVFKENKIIIKFKRKIINILKVEEIKVQID
jgi:hypothetical protein